MWRICRYLISRRVKRRVHNDECDAMRVMCDEVPGGADFVDEVVVAVEDGDREFVGAQILPDVFDWIEFAGAGRQADDGEVVGDGERIGDVIVGAVEDEGGVAARSNLE